VQYVISNHLTSNTFSNLSFGPFQLGSVTVNDNSGNITFTLNTSSASISIGTAVTGSVTGFSGSYNTGSSTFSVNLSGLNLSFSSFLSIQASSAALSLAETPVTLTLSDNTTTRSVTEMTIGLTGATVFAGLNGPATNPGAVGLTLGGPGLDLGLAVLQSTQGYYYYALSSSGGTVGTVGLPAMLSANFVNPTLQVNAGNDPHNLAADFHSLAGNALAIPGSNGISLTYRTPLLDAAATGTVMIGPSMSLSGSLALSIETVSASAPEVSLNGNGLAGTQVLTLGGAGLNAFVGVSGTGVSLSGVNFGLALINYGGKTYWGLDSTSASASLAGLSSFTLSASSLTVQVNQSNDTSGPGGAMVVADFSALNVQTGATSPATVALTELTTSNGAMVEFGGTVTLAFSTSAGSFITLTGSVAVESQNVPGGDVTLSSGTLNSTMLTIGGNGLKFFAGIGGATIPGATAAPYFTGKGVELDGVSFGLAIVRDLSGNTYWGLESTASGAQLVGLPSTLTLSASNLTVELNQSNTSGVATFTGLPVPQGGSQTGSQSLTLNGLLAEVTGTVTLRLAGFAIVMGTVSVQSQTTSGVTLSNGTLDATMLTIGGTGLSVFAGINGAPAVPPASAAPYFTGTGLELDGVSFGLALVTSGARTYWGLEATATSASFDGLPSGWTATFTTVAVELNQSNDNTGVVADFSGLNVPTGASSPATVWLTDLTAAKGALLEASGTVNLNVGGGLSAQGSITVASQVVPTGLATTDGADLSSGTMLTIAGTGLNAFAGVNGTGVSVTGESFGLVFIHSGGFNYWAVKSTQTGTASFTGLPSGVTATASNVSLEVNQSDNFNGTNNNMVVVDFSKLPAANSQPAGVLSIAGSSVTINYNQPLLEASATVNLNLGSYVIVTGTFAIASQTISGGLTLSNGTTLTGPVLTIGGTGVNAFLGTTNGSNRTGLELDGASFGLVFAQGTDNSATHKYWALQAQGGTLQVDGLPGLTVTATNLTVNVNQSDDGTGASMVVVDFTKVHVPSGQTSPGLAVATGSNTSVYLDYSQRTLSVGGAATIAWGTAVSLSGNFLFSIPNAADNPIPNEVFEVGETNLNFDLKAGSTTVVSFNQTASQTGALVIASDGTSTTIAAQATLQFQSGLVGISGTIQLQVNTTGNAVNTTVNTTDGTVALVLTATPQFEVAVTNGYIHLGSIAFPFSFNVVISGGNIQLLQSGSNTLLVQVDSSGNITYPGITNAASLLSNLANLDSPDPAQLAGLLQQLASWLTTLTSSNLLKILIPFTGGTTIGQALNWAQVFINGVYSHLVTAELQSSMVQESGPTIAAGSVNGTLGLQLGSNNASQTPGPAQTLTLNFSYDTSTSNSNSDTSSLLYQLNQIINGNTTLAGNVVAQWDKDGFLSIALTPKAVAAGMTLSMTKATNLGGLGFTLDSNNDAQVAALKSLYNFNTSNPAQGFFGVLETLLQQLPGIALGQLQPLLSPNATQEVYTFPVSFSETLAELSLPFAFGSSFGSIGSASLTGQLNLLATVSASFTLGYDMSAASVPVILSSTAVPVPANGQITQNAVFSVILNGDSANPLPLTLLASATATNNSIGQLVTELNNLFSNPGNTYILNGTPTNLGSIIHAAQAGNEISISVQSAYLGVVNSLELTALSNNSFVTELGFGSHLSGDGSTAYSVATSPIKGLFIEGTGSGSPTLTGSLTVTTGATATTSGGSNGGSPSTATLNLAPAGSSASIGVTLTSTGSSGGDLNGTVVSVTNNPDLASGTPTVTWNGTNKTLSIVVADGVTTVNQVVAAINAAGAPWNAAPAAGTLGTATVSARDIAGSLQLGFVNVSTSAGVVGTYAYDGTTPAPLTVTISLQSQTSGSSRLYLSDLMQAITSGGLASTVSGPHLTGSLLVQLNNINVSGLGFSLPLSNPQISVWIPDITNLNFNPNPYDANDPSANKGIFLTYPNLGPMPDLSNLGFTQILSALQGIANSLSQLSGFSFLNQPLPLINTSINHLLGYATQFSSLITGLSSTSVSSLQDVIANLNTLIDQTLHLSPGVLTIALDDGGLFGATATSSGGVNSGAPSMVTVNLAPDDSVTDTVTIQSVGSNGGDLNGTTVRVLNNPALADPTKPVVKWDATNKVLTIQVDDKVTTVLQVFNAINNYRAANPSSFPWMAAANAGSLVNVSSLVTGGGNASTGSSTIIMPGGENNDFTLTSTVPGTAYNGSNIVILGSSSVSGDSAAVSWNASTKLLIIKINPGQTDANAIVSAINSAGTPWTAALTPTNDGVPNTGAGLVTTFALKLQLKLSYASARQLPFSLNLSQLVGALGPSNSAVAALLNLATQLVQVNASGSLNVSVGANLDLDFGLDITNPLAPRPFFYTDSGVSLTAKITAPDLNLTVSLGSLLGISITHGSAALSLDGNANSGPAQISLTLNNADGSGRLYFSGNWFSSSNFTLTMQGGLGAILPIFIGTVPLGTSDLNAAGYPGNDLVIQVPDLYRLFTDEEIVHTTTGTATLNLPGLNGTVAIKNTGLGTFTVVLDDKGAVGTTTATVNGNTLTITVASDDTSTVGAISGVLPAGFTIVTTGSVTNSTPITSSKVYISTPDISSLFSNLNFSDLLTNNPGLLLDGLDTLLGTIENGLKGIAGNTRLPLVGNSLSKAADFIQQFRSGLLAELRNDLAAAGGNIRSAIQKALWNSLGNGPGGLNILVNPNTGALLTSQQQIDVQFNALTGLVVNLKLAHTIGLVDTSANPINFDIGVPGLGLKATGNVKVSIGYSMLFGFGINKQDGFYFNTPDNITLSFVAAIPGLTLTGQLAFLQLQLQDDASNPSNFTGQFSVTLSAPGGGSKLTVGMLSTASLSDILHADLSADADVNLKIVASFGGNTAFPSLDAEFHLLWSWDLQNGAGAPKVWFDNVGLDLGSFISSFLGPILNVVQQVTEPVQPIINIITARIPILSDLAGSTVTLLTLAQDFGLIDDGTAKFINELAQLITLINDIHSLGSGDIIIPMGAFSLNYDNSGVMQQVQVLNQLENTDFASQIQDAADQESMGSSSFTSHAVGFANDLGAMDGFSFPFIQKPSTLFNLFVGKDVTLVQWQMPEFKFQFSYTQSFPIFPPLFVDFGGSIEADINIGFGYDTYGIREIINDSQHRASDLLDGFYVITTDQNGQPLPALTLKGQIFAGAELNLGIASGGVNGGLEATVNFLWNDNSDNDGKLRFSEIAADAAEGASCIFNITGKVSIFLQAFLNVDLFFFSIHKTWDLGDFTLVDFSITCPQPVLGELNYNGTGAGVLTLNIGTLASLRAVGDTADGSESFTVRDQGASSGGGRNIEVTFDNHSQQFTGVTEIMVLNPGQGTNVVDFRGVTVPVNVTLGPGNDTVYLSDGNNSVVYCGSGSDTINASATATGLVVYGGDGSDTITAGGQPIVVFGGTGNNVIKGSLGADLILGGGGNDTIYGNGGGDIIVTGPGSTTVYAASGTADASNFILADSWLFLMGDLKNVPGFVSVLQAQGTPLSSFIWTHIPATLQNILTSSSATLQQKEVTLVEAFDAILLRQVLAAPASQPPVALPPVLPLSFSAPTAATPALYDSASFSSRFSGVTPSATTQQLLNVDPNPQGLVLIELERSLLADAYSAYVKPRASNGGSIIYGGSQGDVIDGGAGNDKIYGGAADNVLIAGTGNSQVWGSAGNDLVVGAELSSINQFTVTPDNLTNLLAAVKAMFNSPTTSALGISLQGLIGGGNDLLVGAGGSDAVFGGAGNDLIYGGNLLAAGVTQTITPDGNNFITGGTGSDVIFSDDASASNTNPRPTGISIKSSIWYDAPHTGSKLPTDTGFGGVTVSLYLTSAPPGSGSPVATTTTDEKGNFEFDGLNPTSYILVFSAVPGMTFVVRSSGPVSNGSSVDANGQTASISLNLSQTFTDVSAGYSGPLPTISVSNATAAEAASGKTPIVFTLTLAGPEPYPVVVTYSTQNLTAIGGTDYDSVTNGSVTFAAGQTSVQVTVQIDGSTTYGPNKQFDLNVTAAQLMNPGGAQSLTTPVTGIGTIVNPNPLPSISISSYDPGDNPLVQPGDITNASNLVQVLQAHSALVPAALYALYGTSTEWAQVQQLQLSGPSASSAQDIQVALLALLNKIVQGQLIYSQSAFASVTLSTQTQYWLTQNAQGADLKRLNRFLLDDAFTSQLGGIAGYEGQAQTFTVTLSNPSSQTITVFWQTDEALTPSGALQPGSALPTSLPNGNFVLASGTLTFLPNVTSQVITVSTMRNNLPQDSLHYYVDLSNPVGATISQGHAFALIRNLDPPVSVSFVPIPLGGGNYTFQQTAYPQNGPVTVPFNVELSSASGQKVTVTYSTQPGTAFDIPTGPSTPPDFDATSGTLVFQPGQTILPIFVKIEPGAHAGTVFYLNLLSATNATVAANPGPSTITATSQSNHVSVLLGTAIGGNPGPWSISFASSTFDVTEAASGQTTAQIILLRTPGSPQAVAVFYTTDGSATAGTDYVAVRQIVRFAQDQTVMVVPITILNDGKFDGNETVLLSLRNPTGGPVNGTPASAVLTIHDSAAPTIKILPPAAGVTDGGGPAVFTVELLDANGSPTTATYNVTFQYYTQDLTAHSPTDYSGIAKATPMTGVILANNPSTPISITIANNPAAQLTTNFGVVIENPTGATLTVANSSALGTIFNNNPVPIQGLVFYDTNSNGYLDPNESGVANVTVDVTYANGAGTTTVTATTNSQGIFTASVLLGNVSIKVEGSTVTSPLGGPGVTYQTTSNNESQQVVFTGTTGALVFAPVGYAVTTTTNPDPATSKDSGSGHTNSTVFGGPGNDQITVGGGNDYVVGGSWMNATDHNAPVNRGLYDAKVIVTYGIWAIDPSSLTGNQGDITGTVTGPSGQIVGQKVTLYDSLGDPVNVAVTQAGGVYTFSGLYSNGSTPGQYILQFSPPTGDSLTLSGDYSQVYGGVRSGVISVMSGQTVHVNANYAPFSPNTSHYEGFHFGAPAYAVAENVQGGLLMITITRTDASRETPVVLQTFDGTALQNVNYTRVSMLVEFPVGVFSLTVGIPIINTGKLHFADIPLTFTLVLSLPTGQPLDRVTASIGGPGSGFITDDDTIHGGAGIDVIVGDSGYVTPPNSLGPLTDPSTSNITYTGGPGNDTIYGGVGPTYINGELGNDKIYAGLGTETIDGGLGSSTLIASQDVSNVTIAPNPTPLPPWMPPWMLTFANGAAVLGLAKFLDIQTVELLGGAHNTAFEIDNWENPAWVFAGAGGASLKVVNDTNMVLSDVSPAQGQAFYAANGFLEDSTLTLANGSVYALGGLAAISLAGGASADTLNASAYSRAVTFYGSAGGGQMIGGTGNDTFAFDASSGQAPETISGSGGVYTLDFSSTPQTTAITINLALSTPQTVGTILLTLNTSIQDIVDGQGNNTINASSGTHHIILRPYPGSQLVTIAGDGAGTTLDFTAFTSPITVSLNSSAIQNSIAPGAGLSLQLNSASVDNIIVGPGGGTVTGNADNDTFTLTGGATVINGNSLSVNNTVNASANANFILTSNSLNVSGVINTLANIQTVNLTGGSSNNVFTINGFIGTVNLVGGGGSDTLSFLTNVGGTITLSDTAVTVNNVTTYSGTIAYAGGAVNFSGMTAVIATNTGGATTFNTSGWTAGSLTLVGGASDQVVLNFNGTGTIFLTNSAITFGDPVIHLNGIQNVTITDTAPNVIFDLTGWSGTTATLTGGGANDQVLSSFGGSGTIFLTNSAITFGSAVIHLNGIQSATISDASPNVVFNVTGWTNGTAMLTGGGANDQILAQAATAGTITISNTSLAFVGSTINWVSISQITITGSAGNDTFAFQPFSTLQKVTVIGGGGQDRLDFSFISQAINVDLTMTGFQNAVPTQTWQLSVQGVGDLKFGSGGGSVKINSATQNILGGTGPNTIVASGASNYTLTSSSLTADSQNVTLQNIQNATLTGGSTGNDVFSVYLAGWPAGVITLTGAATGANSNTFTLYPQSASPPTVMVNVNDSGTNNTLDVSHFSGVTTSLSQMPATVMLMITGNPPTILFAPHLASSLVATGSGTATGATGSASPTLSASPTQGPTLSHGFVGARSKKRFGYEHWYT
jgi:hypothetical protein